VWKKRSEGPTQKAFRIVRALTLVIPRTRLTAGPYSVSALLMRDLPEDKCFRKDYESSQFFHNSGSCRAEEKISMAIADAWRLFHASSTWWTRSSPWINYPRSQISAIFDGLARGFLGGLDPESWILNLDSWPKICSRANVS
jgi:hypothetical protein